MRGWACRHRRVANGTQARRDGTRREHTALDGAGCGALVGGVFVWVAEWLVCGCVISAGLGEGYDVRGRVCVSVGRAEFVLHV